MKYGIIGSRRRTDRQTIIDFVSTLNPSDTVISGGCIGPDAWAEKAARANGINVLIFYPLLPPKGSPRYEFTKAFYARNKLIVKNSDIIHAFVAPDRKGGTENTIQYAIKTGIPVIIHP